MDTLTLTLTPTLTLTLTQVRRAGLRYLMDTSSTKHPRHASFVDVEPRAGTLVVFRHVPYVLPYRRYSYGTPYLAPYLTWSSDPTRSSTRCSTPSPRASSWRAGGTPTSSSSSSSSYQIPSTEHTPTPRTLH